MAEILDLQMRRSSPDLSKRFVLLVEPKGYAPELYRPFDSEEAAMSFAEIVCYCDDGTSWWVTSLQKPHDTEHLSRSDLVARGWRTGDNGISKKIAC